MKHFFLILATALLLSSCASTYYYSTLDSTTENTIKGDNGDFITANDSVLVAYCFNGEEAPILIIVHNDGNKPLYVDWQRSSMIIREKATSYYNRNIQISGTTESYSQGYNYPIQSSYSSGEFRGRASIPEGVTFIPPHSRIEYRSMRLETPNFENIPDKEYTKVSFIKKDDSPASVKNIDFTIKDTPLKFRSYLTLYTDPNKPFTFEHEFYISNLMKSKELTPSNINEGLMDRGDFFYIEKESGGKDVGAILLGSALVVGAVILDVATYNDRDCCY